MASNSQVAVRQDQQLAPLRSWDELLQISQAVVKNGWGLDGESPEQVALRLLKGQDEGLTPMQALEHVYLPAQGKPAMDSKVLTAKFHEAGHSYIIDTWTENEVSGRFILADGTEHDFTLTMAEVAKYRWNQYYNKSAKSWEVKPTWKGMQKIMLKYRWITTGIRTFAPGTELRRVGQDVVARGAGESEEALEAVYAELEQRDARIAQLEAENAELREVIQALGEEPPERDEVVDGEVREIEGVGQEPATNGRPYDAETVRSKVRMLVNESGASQDPRTASDKQRNALKAIFTKLFPTVDDSDMLLKMRHSVCEYLVGEPSTLELSAAQASAIITWAIMGGDGPDHWEAHPAALQEAARILERIGEDAGQEKLF